MLDALISVTSDELVRGEFVEWGTEEWGDFGTLQSAMATSISKRSARTGRNPQTGKEIKIAAKNTVKFKAGAELSKAVN
ncbi:MAG: HU family DNA-binding protein [Candidatus Paceibacterota bacterium]